MDELSILQAVPAEQLVDRAMAAMRRRDLIEFITHENSKYSVGWFHDDLAAHLEQFSDDVINQRSPRLMLQAPPQHGKSYQASERFPVWHMGRHPGCKIIVASYSLDAALDRSRGARRCIKSDATHVTFPELELTKGSSSIEFWETTTNCSYKAVGVRGGIGGKPAHILLIDDSVRGWSDALSQAYREHAWSWYQTEAHTRLQPGGGILYIGTPWHEDDLGGRLKARSESGDGEPWNVIRYPAIAEEDERDEDGEIVRRKGEELDPERWPLHLVEANRLTMGSRKFGALYLCRPRFIGGNIWNSKWWRFWTHSPLTAEQQASGKWKQLPEKFDFMCQTWDLTLGSLKETSSFCEGNVWAALGADNFLLDESRFRGGVSPTENAIRSLELKWPLAEAKYVEKAALAISIDQELKSSVPGIILVRPEGNKAARMEAVSPFVEAGNVYLPDPVTNPWVRDWIEECEAAPFGANNDRADCASLGLTKLRFRPQYGVRRIGEKRT